MDRLLGKFTPQLETFKVGRQLLHRNTGIPEPDPSELSEEETRLRQGLQWQKTLTASLLESSDAVAKALQSLSGAQSSLFDAGIVEVGVEPDIAQALCQSLREAKQLTAQVAGAVHRPLEAHQQRLAAWLDTVQKSDLATSELKHYEEKLVRLKTDYDEALRKGRASGNEKYAACHELQALESNKRKLGAQQQAARGAKELADKALFEAEAKRAEFGTIAQDVFYGMTEALQKAAKPLQGDAKKVPPQVQQPRSMVVDATPSPPTAPVLTLPPDDSKRSAWASQEQPAAIERTLTPGYAQSLLTSPNLMRTLCQRYFRRYDANGDGVLELSEAMTLIEDLQDSLGVPAVDRPTEQQVRKLVERYNQDRNDDSLSQDNFAAWFSFSLKATLAKAMPGAGAAKANGAVGGGVGLEEDNAAPAGA